MSDEVRTTSATGGAKGRKQAEIAWLDPLSLLDVGRVARMGADKYGDHNFRNGYEWSKCFNAAFRHLAAFWSGEDTDPESGLPHLAHAAWHCLALMTFMREHPEYDDRYRPAIEGVIKEVGDLTSIGGSYAKLTPRQNLPA